MLHVVVVGAGIAGLSAAISLRRAGHTVHVYERSSMNNEIGAAINVPPNATRFLTAWGLDPVRWRFVKSRRVTYNDPFNMKQTALLSTDETARSVGGAELYYAHRVDLHNALKWLATRPEGPGTPATIYLRSEVVGYDPYTPSITLTGGEQITADVVIGADGVHSIASETILGRKNHPVAPIHSNCCYRFLIPAVVLEADCETSFWNNESDGWTRLFPHDSTQRRLVTYPCRDNTIHNFVGIFYDEAVESEKREDWQASVHVSHVLERYSDFDPRLLKVISKATEVKRWPLLYRHPIATWHKGRMALAGDSAHPMLPHQGQGGAQALEDGLALGIALSTASTPKDIEAGLCIYDQVRRNRASVVQILSNVGQDKSHLVKDELLQFMTEEEIPATPGANYKHNFGYDVVEATLLAMKRRNEDFELSASFFEGEIIPVPGRT